MLLSVSAFARFQGKEVFANLNAPPAVTASAVIYALRCLLPGDAADVPLNQVGVLLLSLLLLLPPTRSGKENGGEIASYEIPDRFMFLRCSSCLVALFFRPSR